MSGTTPSRPSPTKTRDHSSLPSPAPPILPKTPKRPGTTTLPGLTPISRGSSIKQRQDGDTDLVIKRDREDYEEYIREDLSCRVFVDYEVFMRYVLHVPKDWKIEWKPALDKIKADANFKKHHEEYCRLCNINGAVRERLFYSSLKKTANAVLDVVSGSEFDGIPSEKRQYYHVNEPKHVKGGVMNKRGLSPDLVVLDKDHPDPGKTGSIHWANPLHVLEVKPDDNAICDGTCIPRLVVDGIDPINNHARPPTKLRHRPKQPDPLATPTPSLLLTTSQSASKSTAASTSKKRPADDSSAADPRAAKKSKASSVSPQVPDEGASAQKDGGDKEPSPPQLEPQKQVEPSVQVCRYLLEMFSVPLLRSHATASLVDRDRLQLYHANRSVILVSSAINFSTDDGKDKLIATIIAFHRLTRAQNGILSVIPKNVDLLSNANLSGEARVVQRGNKLHFSGKPGREAFTVELTDVISCDPAMVGRSTLVLNAKSAEWGGPLVIKISWPTSGRVPETDFLEKANTMAQGEHEWAAKHLPKLHYAEDVVFDAKSTLGLVAGLFENAEFVNGNYVYERRTLRIIIQERLYPFKSLTNVKDIGQVFVDVLCVHRWLYDKPGILHRDLSLNNIMYRFDKGAKGKPKEVYGVLTDYDLSSWMDSLNPDYTKTSQQRTGTPPFMAQELLRGLSPLHLYRHDVESLFYIMLLVSARYSIGIPKQRKQLRVIMRGTTELPYEDWFNERRYHVLGYMKSGFLTDKCPIELSPDFEAFRPWLDELRANFREGFKLQPTDMPLPARKQAKKVTVQFDDETLGGWVEYADLLEAIPLLEGELKGLTIRYPKSSSAPGPSTSAGAA